MRPWQHVPARRPAGPKPHGAASLRRRVHEALAAIRERRASARLNRKRELFAALPDFGTHRAHRYRSAEASSCPQIASRMRIRGPPSGKGEGERNAERRALVTAAACFPDCRETEAHGNAFQRPPRRLLDPRSVLRRGARISPYRQVSRTLACPVQPLRAEPRSGPGRLPKAPRVRRARPPRPQAPHPAARDEACRHRPAITVDRRMTSGYTSRGQIVAR